jgi:hypothetical protein
VLHFARHDRRPRAASTRGRFGALRDDDLVVYILVDHVEFVDVVVPSVFRRHEYDDARCRTRWDVIYADFPQLDALGVELGPTLHQKFWDLRRPR